MRDTIDSLISDIEKIENGWAGSTSIVSQKEKIKDIKVSLKNAENTLKAMQEHKAEIEEVVRVLEEADASKNKKA